jgi:hypothetical protein
MTGEIKPATPEAMVTELKGTEGGRWQVKSHGSLYLFDLDGRPTVTRIPGPNATPNVNDCTRPLREIESISVGRRGYWTMEPDHFLLDCYWQITSRIEAITRCPDHPIDDQNDPAKATST